MASSLLSPPLLAALASAEKILIAGAGGGYDVFCGLPLYFHLKGLGKEVHLANLSFSELGLVEDGGALPHVVTVDADSRGLPNYFPEKFLCEWLRRRGDDSPVHCFERTGVAPLTEAYRALVSKLGVDALVLVDGGTDSLMRGDEVGLGTPQEDIASILAASSVEGCRSFLVCLGFGVDAFHGVCHAHFLEAVAAHVEAGAFLGAFSLLPHFEECKLFAEACEFVYERMPRSISIVNSSIAAAIEGRYGDVHRTIRTQGSKLWINPQMALYWAFDLAPVAGACLYADWVRHTRSWDELDDAILRFRQQLEAAGQVRGWEHIPV